MKSGNTETWKQLKLLSPKCSDNPGSKKVGVSNLSTLLIQSII